MTKDEALKMAIKEMTDVIPHLDVHFDDYFEAIQACKEALEQPSCDKVTRLEVGEAEIKQMLNDIEYYQKRVEALEQPAQAKADFDVMAYGQSFMLDGKHIPLSDVYSHPAPPWQGLSDDESQKIVDDTNVDMYGCSIIDFINIIEAKLKEKNTP